MLPEELKNKITELLPTASFEEGANAASGWVTVNMEATDWLDFATKVKQDHLLAFDYMFCLTCVDWKTHLTMVYNLDSTSFRHNLVVKIKLDRDKQEIESVSELWRTAEFHEREVYEMFGVNFLNHPDLRLLILPDGWEGKNPMRKDFEDAVNMIRL